MELPITSTFAGVLALILLPLTLRVSFRRVALGKAMGDITGVVFGDGDDEVLRARIRAMGNFVEYVPLCLILLALSEMQGAPAVMLWGIGSAFVVGRLAHAIGMSMHKLPPPRGFGMLTTYVALLGLGGWLVFHGLSY